MLYTASPRFAALAWLRGGERFPRGAQIFLLQEGRVRSFLPSFAASADPNVSFDGTRVLFAGKRRRGDHWQIWEASQDGGDPRRITSCSTDCVRPFYLPEDRVVYSRKVDGRFVIEAASTRVAGSLVLTYFPGSALVTDVLRDGRILFEAGYPMGNGTEPEIYTVYSDGSGVESYRCDHAKARHSGKQVGSGDIVFARDRGLGRFTSAFAHQVETSTPAGEYSGDVVELGPGEWVVSRRSASSASALLQNRRRGASSGTSHFEVVGWSAGLKEITPLISDSVSDLVQPTVLALRPIPNRHPSGLHDWSYANLLCLNAYTSKDKFGEGSIAQVRLYKQGTRGKAELLGTARVEKDGSFYLRTPADQPLKIEIVDANGKTLKSEAGWFWLRKGEQRICVGCHAGPETAPENAVPMVLQRSTMAADVTGTPQPPSVQGGH